MSFEFQDYDTEHRTPDYQILGSDNNPYSSEICPYYSPYNGFTNAYEREKGLLNRNEAVHGHFSNFIPAHHSYNDDSHGLQYSSHDAGLDAPRRMECREPSYNHNICHDAKISDKTYDISTHDRYVNGHSHFLHVHGQGIISHEIIAVYISIHFIALIYLKTHDYEIITTITYRINF